ncbi:hypothetical protein [Psychrobacter sp. ASPA161_9]
MYEYGHGVRQNYGIAKEWYGKSCDMVIKMVVIIIEY